MPGFFFPDKLRRKYDLNTQEIRTEYVEPRGFQGPYTVSTEQSNLVTRPQSYVNPACFVVTVPEF